MVEKEVKCFVRFAVFGDSFGSDPAAERRRGGREEVRQTSRGRREAREEGRGDRHAEAKAEEQNTKGKRSAGPARVPSGEGRKGANKIGSL